MLNCEYMLWTNYLIFISFLFSTIPLLISYSICHKKLNWRLNPPTDNYCTIATNLQLGYLIKYSFYILSASYFVFITASAKLLNVDLDLPFLFMLITNSLFFLLFGWSVNHNSTNKHSYVSRLSIVFLGITSLWFTTLLHSNHLTLFFIALTPLVIGSFISTTWLIKSKNSVDWKIQLFITIVMDLWMGIILLDTLRV